MGVLSNVVYVKVGSSVMLYSGIGWGIFCFFLCSYVLLGF